MRRVKQVTIENYRSIQDQVVIDFPENCPVILVGENNAGKSNIIRAVDLIFGEFHPKYKDLDDFDHFNRDPRKLISIEASVSGYEGRLGRSREFSCTGFQYSRIKGTESSFNAVQSDGNPNQYVSNDLRGEISAVLVSSEQNLSYQLSYASKFTLLSKLTRAFHDRLTESPEKVDALKGMYAEIVQVFLSVPEFKAFSGSMSSIAKDVLSGMSYGLELDFSSYDPSNYYRNMRVMPKEGNDVRSFEELGTGQQQILALAFAHAYSKSFAGGDLLLILDEPESHLHPIAQRWLATNLYQMAKDGLQLIVTTHSPHFINLEFIEGLYLVRKDADGSFVTRATPSDLAAHCIAKGSDALRTTESTIVPFYNASATTSILNGLFAKKVVLVEGPTEELALPIYLQKAGLDTLQSGIDIISVGGKGNLAKWHRFFSYYGIPTYVCFDNDGKHDKDGVRRKDALKAIGIQDAEIDGLINGEDWSVGAQYCVFGKDLEKSLVAVFPEYEGLEVIVKAELGDSKPIVAREIAKRLQVEESEGWAKLTELAEAIRSL
jgi:putative ATP-dependent endonuclease of the OLD family